MEKIRGIADSIITKIIVLILLLILPMNIMLVTVTRNSMDTVISQTVYSTESNLNIYMGQLDREMQNIDTYLYSLIDNDIYFWQLVQAKESDKRTLARFNLNNEFEKQLLLNNRYAGLFWYREGDGILLNLRRNQLAFRESMEAYLTEKAVRELENGWHIINIDGEDYILHIIRQHEVYLGGLIRVSDIISEAENAFEYQDKNVMLSEKIPPVKEEGKLIAHASSRLSNSSLILSLVLSRKEVLERLPFLQKINYYAAILLMAVVPALLLIFRKILIIPLHRINAALKRIEDEEMDYRIAEYRTSLEFANINHAFNSMMDQILQLKIDNYEREIEKNQMEVKNLQLQIRPHFLLNTFNLVYSLAQMRDYEGVQKMILCLTTYYRDGIRGNEDFRTVEKELAFVENYLEMARMRYPDCFEVEFEVEEDMKQQMIPTLLIHTFVENIIAHLVRIGSFLTITIRVQKEKGKVLIQVCDDGEGIAQDILAEINGGRVVMKNGEEHIGIWNCRKRLTMLYGSKASLRVESEEYAGTKISVRFPQDRTEQLEGKV